MSALREQLEQYFEFQQLNTNWRTEILAGFTTFVTTAYIIFVNPSILHEAGMPVGAVTAATCICAAFSSILMGVLARYPIALAPGMGLNAYFTYTVVKGLGVPWQTALGAVFLSGIAFLILTVTGIRQMIVQAIPAELYAAVGAGIGLFIGLVGFRNSGLITGSQATLVTIGNLRNPSTLCAIFGLLLMTALLIWKVRGAILIGVIGTTAVGALLGVVHWQPQSYGLGDIRDTAFHLDIAGAWKLGLAEIVFVFLFVDFFDNVGTLLAVGKKAGLFDQAGHIPRIDRILITDACSTVVGSLAGTSTVVSYLESAAGVVAGGRSGVVSIVVGALFIVSLFVAPLIGAIPAAATAPALIVVGSMMLAQVSEIRWSDPVVALPAFLTLTMIPLTFSIANGLAFGFSSYTLLKMAQGRFRDLNWLMYLMTALFLVRFFYLGAG